jgi:plasmid stabilization system protein ParE
MMRVVLSRRAEEDLAKITDYIALYSPARVHSFEDELLAQCIKIGLSPMAYVAQPEHHLMGRGLIGSQVSHNCIFRGTVYVRCDNAMDRCP